jgi:hypothetical protein
MPKTEGTKDKGTLSRALVFLGSEGALLWETTLETSGLQMRLAVVGRAMKGLVFDMRKRTAQSEAPLQHNESQRTCALA